MKNVIVGLVTFAMVATASAGNITNLFPNGDFEQGGAGAWAEAGGGDTFEYPSADGNPNGYGIIDDSSATWGIWVGGDASPLPLASLGLTAGQTYTFVQDMKILSGTSIGGLKVESWNTDINPSGALDTSGDMHPSSGTTNWATYTFSYKINPLATGVKIVPLWGLLSRVGFDNLGVIVRAPEPLAVTITTPPANQVVYSNFNVNASATLYPGTITNVAFYMDGNLKVNVPNAPYGYTATGVAVGSHALQAFVSDSNGNIAQSAVINIVVTNLAVPAGAITIDSSSSGSTGTTPSSVCTWPHTVNSGVNRMLVVGVSAESSTDAGVSSLTYGGVALMHVPNSRAVSSATVDSADLWYLLSPPVGTANIIVTFANTLTNTFPTTGAAACGAVSLFGVNQNGPEVVVTNSTRSTQTNTISTSITTLTPGSMLVDVVNNGNGGATSTFSTFPGTKQWDLRASSSATICSGGGATVAVPAATTVTDTWVCGVASRMSQSIGAFAPAIPVLSSESASITSPTNGAQVSMTSFTISADASVSPGTITNVNFYIDGSLVGNDTTSPYAFTKTGISPGAHTLAVVAKDNGGNSATSSVVNVTAVNFAPSVSLNTPANGTAVLVGANVALAATATDDGSISSVDFQVDGVTVGSDSAAPYAATWNGATAGVHLLTAVAHDNGGLSTTSSVVSLSVLTTFAAYEPFNYFNLPNGTPTTADGFTGNWTASGANMVGGLSYSDLPNSAFALSSSAGRQFENFAAPLSSGTEWVSFLINQSGDGGGVKNGVFLQNGGTGLFIGFGLAPFSAAQGFIGLGAMNTAGAAYQDATKLVTSTNLSNYGQTYFVVLRIDFNTSSNNDTVSVYINPPTHASVPSVAPDMVLNSFDVGTITGIGMNVGNTTFTMDEIRRASTYAEVAGGALNPTIPTTLALSVGPNKRISWTASNTNYYQPQRSFDGSSWDNLGPVLFGTAVTSVYDPVPAPFYQVEEIAPAIAETLVDGGIETDGGAGNAFYWSSLGTQPPVRITSDFHSGTASMSLFVTNSDTTAQTSDMQQNLTFAGSGGVTGGATYNFSFWAKSLGRNPAGGYVQQYKITWFGSSGIVGAVGFTPFTAGANWGQVTSGPIVAPANAVNALIEIFVATGGIANDYGGVEIDDLSLGVFSPGAVINTLTPTVQNGQGFTAVIQDGGNPATAATGTVQFTTNSINQSVGTVVNGTAFSTPVVLPAAYTVTATYSGDATYITSTATLTVGGGGGVNSTPTNIVSSVSGNQLTLAWPADHTGWTLQAQTNSITVGITTNWFDVPGSTGTNKVTFTITPANATTFYRLKF